MSRPVRVMRLHPGLLTYCSLLLFLSGCAGLPPPILPPDQSKQPVTVELEGVPFHPQTEFHCGPAALATALGAEGNNYQPEALAESIYIPELKGSLQPELLAAARQRGFVPVQLEPTLEALVGTLREGKSVIVFQNLNTPRSPHWHYAVLIGFNYTDQRFILRSGATKRKTYASWRFDQTWKWGGRWAVVLLKPDEMLSTLPRDNWYQALAQIEQTDHIELARAGYAASIARWPDSTTALAGYGNTEYKLGNANDAERTFRTLLSVDPDHLLARNNLGHILMEKGCNELALEAIQPAYSAIDGTHPFYATVSETWNRIQSNPEIGNECK